MWMVLTCSSDLLIFTLDLYQGLPNLYSCLFIF